MVVPLLYPVALVIAPGWGYQGSLNWSSRTDTALQWLGLGPWAAGMIVLVWAARILGRFMDVDRATEDHELVASSPYR